MERLSLKKIAQAAVALLETTSPQEVMRAVAALLVEQRRVREADMFVEELGAQLWRVHGHATVELRSARPLAPASLKEATAFLTTYLQATTLAVTTIVDPALKGGLVATTPLGTFDASVASRLNLLKHL